MRTQPGFPPISSAHGNGESHRKKKLLLLSRAVRGFAALMARLGWWFSALMSNASRQFGLEPMRLERARPGCRPLDPRLETTMDRRLRFFNRPLWSNPPGPGLRVPHTRPVLHTPTDGEMDDGSNGTLRSARKPTLCRSPAMRCTCQTQQTGG